MKWVWGSPIQLYIWKLPVSWGSHRLIVFAWKILPFGVLSGHRAGMMVVNVPDPRYPLTEAQAAYADLVLDSLAEFTGETLRRLENSRADK